MKRLGILVVAYNASSTLASVLDRIPADVRARVSEVLVFDDHSDDATYLVGLGYRQLREDLPLTVMRHSRNLGYGGNQKAGYQWAIDHGLDIIVLLHGDGQYAPEFMPDIIAPLEGDEADAVFGSRMMQAHSALRGGMPFYKYAGNRILTRAQNALVGLELSEWHSGYRAYSVAALRDIPLMSNSDNFDFDTEIIIQLHEAGKRIVEVPIPTYYGDEICHVSGLRYARDVIVDSARYRLHKAGLGSGELAFASDFYELKHSEDTSHGRLIGWLQRRPPGRVLDLGCSDGRLGEQIRALGHEVTGVDVARSEDVGERLDAFVQADLDRGIPQEVGGGYDVVLAADVLEHVRHPERVLRDARQCLRTGGSIMTSVPNFAHWYARVRVATGTFDYDRRGILDRDHVRFFTRSSFERLVATSGCVVRRRENIGAPTEVVERGGTRPNRATSMLDGAQALAVNARPSLFAYQFVYELDPVVDHRETAPTLVDVAEGEAPQEHDRAFGVMAGVRNGGALAGPGSAR